MSISQKYHIGPIKHLINWTYKDMSNLFVMKKMKTKIILRFYFTYPALKYLAIPLMVSIWSKRGTHTQPVWRWIAITLRTFRHYVVVLNIPMPHNPVYCSQMYTRTSRPYKEVYNNIVQNSKRIMWSRVRVWILATTLL